MRPAGVPSRWWLARRPLEEGGDGPWRPDLQTSSTGPTSMPSSSDAVATSARRSPRATSSRRACGVPWKRLPWWAATSRPGSPATSAPPGRPPAARQLVGDSFGELPRVEKMRVVRMTHMLGDAVEDVTELLGAGSPPRARRRQLDGHVDVTAMAPVDPRRGGPTGCARQERATLEGRCWRRARCAARSPLLADDVGQALEAEGEVRAALVSGQGVDSSTMTVCTRPSIERPDAE